MQLPKEIQDLAAAGRIVATDIEALWKMPEEKQVEAAEKIVSVKRIPGKRLPRHLRREFKPRKTKEEIGRMTGTLLNAGINGLPPRLLAWAAGRLTDREIRREIKKHAPEYDFESDEIGL